MSNIYVCNVHTHANSHTHVQAEDDISRSTSRFCKRKSNVMTCNPQPLVKSLCTRKLKVCQDDDLHHQQSSQDSQSAQNHLAEAETARQYHQVTRDNDSEKKETAAKDSDSENSDPVTLTLPGFPSKNTRPNVSQPPSTYMRHSDEHTTANTHDSKTTSTRTEHHAQDAKGGRHRSKPPSTQTKFSDHDIKAEKHMNKEASTPNNRRVNGQKNVNTKNVCTSNDWDKYGRLLDVDDLKDLPCAQLDMTACLRCRSEADCTAKNFSCGKVDATSQTLGQIGGTETYKTKTASREGSQDSKDSNSRASRRTQDANPHRAQTGSNKGRHQDSKDSNPRASTKKNKNVVARCSPADWEIYGVLMDVDDLIDLPCEHLDMEVCVRCRGVTDCNKKKDSCGGAQLEDVLPQTSADG